MHHLEGGAIVLGLVYKGVPMQVVKVYMSAEGTAKEYCPLLHWLRAHVAPDSRLVLMWGGGGTSSATRGGLRIVCRSTPRSLQYCLSLSLIWLYFRSPMACLAPRGSVRRVSWVLRTFSLAAVSPGIRTVRVENESVFPLDHYPVRRCLHTLPALVPPGNPTSRARSRLGTGVCKWQQKTFADSLAGLRSLPPTSTLESYQHFVNVLATPAETVFGRPGTPDTVFGLVYVAARVLYDLLKAHRCWWLTAPLVCKVVAARKEVRQAWEVVGLERSLEVVPLARPRFAPFFALLKRNFAP